MWRSVRLRKASFLLQASWLAVQVNYRGEKYFDKKEYSDAIDRMTGPETAAWLKRLKA